MTQEKTFPTLAATIKRLTGLDILPEKYYLFEHRFPEIMRESGIKDFEELDRMLAQGSDQKLVGRVIEKITTHETKFFRDESIFSAFAEQILPEWKERNAFAGLEAQYLPLKIWSAACSTGQEVYSIAMILAEFHPQLIKNTQITATDISEETVERAKQGFYSDFEISRGLPENYRKKYFVEKAGGAQIRRELLPPIQFQAANLLNCAVQEKFDIIFCRNVAYYFAEDARVKLFQKMQQALKSDGVLIIGSAESLSGILDGYVLREFGLARYYELNTQNISLFKRAGQ